MAPIGKVIAHPLKAQFEKSLNRALGSKKRDHWMIGDEVSLNEFNNVQNKGFVRSQLEASGFMISNDVSTYTYVGTVIKSNYAAVSKPVKSSEKPRNRCLFKTPKRKNPRYDWVAKEVLKVSPRLRGLLRHLMLFEYVSTGHLDKAGRKRVSDMVTALRAQGYTVGMTREWSEAIGTNVTIYKLKTPSNCELLEAC